MTHRGGSALLTSRLATALLVVLASASPGPAEGAGTLTVEFLGRSEQAGASVTHFGYLTHVDGMDDAALFSDPAVRTEATARFTFVATTTLNARHVLDGIIVTAAPGTLTIVGQDVPGASFADPASFAAGSTLATFAIRYHNVLNTADTPMKGRASAAADVVQLGVPDAAALRGRLTATGQGTLTVPDPPTSFFLLGGSIVFSVP
ncbi:MAG: hypothetical protein ACREMB_24025 [Candidatus Rokuibacteriota bacterium]